MKGFKDEVQDEEVAELGPISDAIKARARQMREEGTLIGVDQASGPDQSAVHVLLRSGSGVKSLRRKLGVIANASRLTHDWLLADSMDETTALSMWSRLLTDGGINDEGL